MLTPEQPGGRDMSVHNHGPAEGRGLDCPERRLPDGSLRGACMTVHPSTELVEAIAEHSWSRVEQEEDVRQWSDLAPEIRSNLREYWLEHLTVVLPVLVAHGWTPPQEGK